MTFRVTRTENPPSDITALLVAWNDGNAEALDQLLVVLYPELRRIARGYLSRRRPGDSVESASLTNEAYLKLVRAGAIRCENRVHFLALCSQVMRRVLVDHARRRSNAKRGGNTVHVALDEAVLTAAEQGVGLLALHEALEALGAIDRRKARVVELRYFGGLSLDEIAEVLGTSRGTIKRDWRLARAWLLSQLAEAQASSAQPES